MASLTPTIKVIRGVIYVSHSNREQLELMPTIYKIKEVSY